MLQLKNLADATLASNVEHFEKIKMASKMAALYMVWSATTCIQCVFQIQISSEITLLKILEVMANWHGQKNSKQYQKCFQDGCQVKVLR